MDRMLKLAFGIAAYVIFLATFLYAIGFVGGFGVPKAIDDGLPAGMAEAVLVDLALLTLFAMQHSVMARPGFKAVLTRIVPASVERSLYVLLASLALALLFWQWRPMPDLVWHATSPAAIAALYALQASGWAVVLISTFLISHFELFGLRQVFFAWSRRAMPETAFRTPGFYKLVRHPLYVGFLIAFWATPSMSMGHLMFAAVTTAYILVAIQLEERDLVRLFGRTYQEYRTRVGMLLPKLGRRIGDKGLPVPRRG